MWGSFGWLTRQFPHWVYVLVAIAIGLVAAAGGVVLVRDRERLAGRWGEIALLVATPLAVMVAVHVGLVTTSPRPAPAEQGRYLFPALRDRPRITAASWFCAW